MINETALEHGKARHRFLHIAIAMLAILTALTCVFIFFARPNMSATVTEPPSDLLPGKQRFPWTVGCNSLHDGRFICDKTLRGSQIELTYDAIKQQIVYTVISTPDQTLADLLIAWGKPTGITNTGQSVAVFWSTRVAYLAPYSFRPETQVKHIAYGDALKQTLLWRGFISQNFSLETH